MVQIMKEDMREEKEFEYEEMTEPNEQELMSDRDEEVSEFDEDTLEEIEKIEEESRNLDVDETLGVSDSVRMYLKEMGEYPLMTAEQEVECAKRIEAGDVSSRDELA
jgi:RNA polymerase primary sigma factor